MTKNTHVHNKSDKNPAQGEFPQQNTNRIKPSFAYVTAQPEPTLTSGLANKYTEGIGSGDGKTRNQKRANEGREPTKGPWVPPGTLPVSRVNSNESNRRASGLLCTRESEAADHNIPPVEGDAGKTLKDLDRSVNVTDGDWSKGLDQSGKIPDGGRPVDDLD